MKLTSYKAFIYIALSLLFTSCTSFHEASDPDRHFSGLATFLYCLFWAVVSSPTLYSWVYHEDSDEDTGENEYEKASKRTESGESFFSGLYFIIFYNLCIYLFEINVIISILISVILGMVCGTYSVKLYLRSPNGDFLDKLIALSHIRKIGCIIVLAIGCVCLAVFGL